MVTKSLSFKHRTLVLNKQTTTGNILLKLHRVVVGRRVVFTHWRRHRYNFFRRWNQHFDVCNVFLLRFLMIDDYDEADVHVFRIYYSCAHTLLTHRLNHTQHITTPQSFIIVLLLFENTCVCMMDVLMWVYVCFSVAKTNRQPKHTIFVPHFLLENRNI